MTAHPAGLSGVISPVRTKTVGRIADHLAAATPGHPLRVAVDGITASGKSTFARELAGAVRSRGRATISVSMDGFHHLRAHRHRQGRDSAIGYYQDAYDFASFARLVLVPLGPDGDGRFQARIIDLATDEPARPELTLARPDAVLIVDGSFLQRAELAGLFDEVVYLDTSFAVARARGSSRDAAMFGGAEQAGLALDSRYHAAMRMYLADADPARRASIVVGNDDLAQPQLRRIGGPGDGAPGLRLFSYGTLQQPEVQISQFGRRLTGEPDTLPGHRQDWVTITDPGVIAASRSDRHPVVRASGNPADFVTGTVFAITPAELAAADRYEVEDYRRVLARLGSGADSWLYLAAGPPVIAPA